MLWCFETTDGALAWNVGNVTRATGIPPRSPLSRKVHGAFLCPELDPMERTWQKDPLNELWVRWDALRAWLTVYRPDCDHRLAWWAGEENKTRPLRYLIRSPTRKRERSSEESITPPRKNRLRVFIPAMNSPPPP